MRKRGEIVPPELRRQRSIAYYEIYYWDKLERQRLRKEAAKP